MLQLLLLVSSTLALPDDPSMMTLHDEAFLNQPQHNFTEKGLPDDGGDPFYGAPFGDSSGGALPYIWRDPGEHQKGSFEIHSFDIGQGASQLIVFPSGYSILIDVNEDYMNCNGAELTARKVKAVLGHTNVDVGVISHLHMDHVGYTERGGFWCFYDRDLISFKKLIDRDSGVWVDKNNDGECVPEEIEWHNVGAFSSTATRWLCYAQDPKSSVYAIRETAKLGSTTQISPPDEDAKVTIIMTDGLGVKQADGTPVSGDNSKMAVPPSENDYCIALKIEFGSIVYATAGDSDGVYDRSSYGYTYNDVESVMAPKFGIVDIVMSNHHGSGHSTNQYYIDVLQPQVVFIQCGYGNSYGHPPQVILDRLLQAGDVYFPKMCDLTRNYGNAIITEGDVKMRSHDGKHFEVNGRHYKAKALTPTPPPTPTPAPTPPPAPTQCCYSSAATCTEGNVCCLASCKPSSTNPASACSYTQTGCSGQYGRIHNCQWDSDGVCRVGTPPAGKAEGAGGVHGSLRKRSPHLSWL
jgi:hypothetical protein